MAARLAGDSLASGAAIVVVGLSLAVHGVVVGRTLGPVALGHAGVALALGLGVPQLAGAGLSPAITRFTALRRGSGDAPGAWRAATGGLAVLVGSTAAIAAVLWPARAVWAPAIGLPPAEVAATLCLAVVEAGYIGLKATLYGLGRARAYARCELLAGTGFIAALVWLAVAPPEARPALVVPFIAADAIFVVLAASSLRPPTARSAGAGGPAAERIDEADRLQPPAGEQGTAEAAAERTDEADSRRPPAGDRGMAAYAIRASVGSGAAIARLRLVPIVLGLAHGAGEIGRLQAAFAFFGPVMLVPRAVELALFPSLAGAHGRGDGRAFLAQAATAQRAIAIGMALLAGVPIVAGPALLSFVFGPEFAAAALPLALVAAAAWCLGLAVPSIVALSGADGIGIVNAGSVLGLAGSVIAWIVLVPPFGAAGAAAGLALGSIPTAVVPMVAASRRYGLRWRAAAVSSILAATAAGGLASMVAASPGRATSFASAAAVAYAGAVLAVALPWLRRLATERA